ncbi:hypothetical protein [Patulibacter sp.]|uniref:hypothetical protein n=1 Tax=Patulibacter sp. TaxID=1912859 RepID=UPI002716CA4E|nr:hypothetical protein [Patulibacter sp.]MDO9407177.1 hypothetical protein [Patulibacter sp.]
MSFSTVLLINLGILAVVLVSDLGRKPFNRRRLVRPLIVSGIAGATMVQGVPSHGDGLLLVVAGVSAGVVLGALAGRLIRVDGERDGVPLTVAGAPYAAFWATAAAARIAFSYGAEHWFAADLGSWMMQHRITPDALTDALVLMALAMVMTRTLSVVARVRTASGSAGLSAITAR